MKLIELRLKILALKVAIVALLAQILKMQKQRRPDPAETIEEMIRRIANEEKVDEDLAVRVALCESNLDPKARRINRNGTIDRGLYQWNDFWHPEVSDEEAYDPEKATRLFCKAVREGHLNWWNASRSCWES